MDAKDFRKPTTEEAFKVNKICISKFNGGVENWLKYWGKFKSAVHDNPRMSQDVKMVHLMETITEPTAISYMTTCTLEEGDYAKAVEYLQERFDQPRELHQIHCRKIADLQPIKRTQAELVHLASTVFNAISELERQGQATANAVLMSLVGSVIPKLLRNEWETLTHKVPDLHDWIKFVRTKSVIAGREQKPVVLLWK